MTTQQEAQAVITAAQIYLKRYKAANSALREAKAVLEEYMDDQQIEDVTGTVEGSGARIIHRAGDRQLLLDNMEDELILWCAREGVLSGSITAFDKLPAATRQTLEPYLGLGAGTTYVDIYSPPWGQVRQQQKDTARAERAEPAPLPPPRPIRQPAANGTAPPVQQPARNGSAAQNPPRVRGAAMNATTQAELTCPEHNDAAPSNKHGGNYCPHKTNDGAWCKWTTAKAVS